MIGVVLGTLALVGAAQVGSAPSGPRWSLQVASAQCLLERQSNEPASTLSIETAPGSDSYRLALASPNLKAEGTPGPASLTFGPSTHVLKGYARMALSPEGTPLFWMQGIAPVLLDELSGAETVVVATPGGASAVVPLAGAAKAVAALRRCSADQLIEWGADGAQFEAGGRPPVPRKNRDEWISNQDVLAIAGQSTRPQINDLFRVGVSPEGKVDDCQPVAGGVEPGVERIACAAVMNKPLFTPASNATGTPVRGVATFRVSVMREPA